MDSSNIVRQIALGFTDTVEEPHFEKTSFRIKKKIFATLDEKNNMAVVKLSPYVQKQICDSYSKFIQRVPSKWGEQGWTQIDLSQVNEEILYETLSAAYQEVSKKK